MQMLRPNFGIAALLVPILAPAQQAADQDRDVELYQGPVSRSRAVPEYPTFPLRRAMEGWVELNFMVDTEGRPYEIHVANQVGNETFVRAARDALEETVFTPAMIGGRAVDGSSTIVYRFEIEGGGDGASPGFASRYQRFIRRLEEGSQSDVARELARLEEGEIRNNYEYAYLNLARYYFARRYGTPPEQMEYLADALGESIHQPEYDSYLPEDIVTSARRALFQLRIESRYFQEALDTWRLMARKGDREGTEIFQETYEQLVGLRATEEPFSLDGRLDRNGSWDIRLFKDSFHVEQVEGTVDELKLRCERDYVFFAFDAETRYDVSEGAGECSLEVIGDADTTFVLVQQ